MIRPDLAGKKLKSYVIAFLLHCIARVFRVLDQALIFDLDDHILAKKRLPLLVDRVN